MHIACNMYMSRTHKGEECTFRRGSMTISYKVVREDTAKEVT